MVKNKKMIVLHVLYAEGGKESGVRSVVPQHLIHQSKYADVALLNCNDSNVDELNGICDVYKLSDYESEKIETLPVPFNKPDLVVFHSIYYFKYIKVYKECKKRNIPYIILPHGSLTKKAQRQKWYKKIPANIIFFNGYINNALAIQYLVDGEREASCFNNKYLISGNGINIINSSKTYSNKKFKNFKVIFIGRYDVYIKGLDLLIKAAKKIERELKNKNIKIYLYGTDHKGMKRELEKLINKLQLKDIVILNGPLWGSEKIEKLIDADVYIQPSRTEAQSIGLMEAINIGIPCIITKETNYGEIVEKEKLGWMSETTPEGISKKILEAYNDRNKFQQMCEKGKLYAKNHFDWDVIARNSINQYKKLLKEDEINDKN